MGNANRASLDNSAAAPHLLALATGCPAGPDRPKAGTRKDPRALPSTPI